jgi:Na+-driven multidrug efflux pump
MILLIKTKKIHLKVINTKMKEFNIKNKIDILMIGMKITLMKLVIFIMKLINKSTFIN